MCMVLLRGPQDYEIECPQTGTLFSLKTGEITSWCCPMPCPHRSINCTCHELFDSAKLWHVGLFSGRPASAAVSERGLGCEAEVCGAGQVPEQPGAAAHHAAGDLPQAGRVPGQADAGRRLRQRHPGRQHALPGALACRQSARNCLCMKAGLRSGIIASHHVRPPPCAFQHMPMPACTHRKGTLRCIECLLLCS